MKKQTVHLFVFNTLADWETGFAISSHWIKHMLDTPRKTFTPLALLALW